MERKKLRSPSYPTFDLETAVGKVKSIQADYNKSAVDHAALARSMGYSSLSGSALQALATLKNYFLLERRGKGEAAVTDLAMQILFAESAEEHARAARMAALSPQVFNQIDEKFEGHIPHENGVEAFLRRTGFTEKAAKIASRSYVASMRFVSSLGDGDRSGADAVTGHNPPAPMNEEEDRQMNAARAGAVGEFRDLVRGQTSDGSAFRLLVNADFGAEQWEDTMALLEVQHEIAKRKAERDQPDAA